MPIPKPITVLIAEDDRDLSDELADFLTHAGFAVSCATTFIDASRLLQSNFDLVVLDINFPDGSGLDLMKIGRVNQRSGVIMLTAQGQHELRVATLREGADAFLVKPVHPEELEATLLSVHRRLVINAGQSFVPVPKNVPWRLDATQGLLTAPNAVSILLLPHESRLLAFLFSQPERSASRDAILALYEEKPNENSANRLEVMISRLRRKVSSRAGVRLPLVSHYGRGYAFNAHVHNQD